MTSSEERPSKTLRRLLPLVLLAAVLFGCYSAGWYWLAQRVRAETEGTIAALNAKGIEAECINMQVGGYPLRLRMSCAALAYQDDAANVAASAGSLAATASLPFFWMPTAELRGPLRIAAPRMAPLWIDWDRLEATTALSWWQPKEVALAAEGFSGQTDPSDDSDPVQLFSIANATAQLRPQGPDLDYSSRFSELQIDAEAIGGRMLPPLDGSGRVMVKNGVALIASANTSLRGQAVEITSLDLSSGEARVSMSGLLSVDADGLVDAELTIRLKNPKAVAEVLAGAIPENARQIRQGFAALALLGSEPTMPLKIVKGKASLSFVRLGDIKPLQ